MSAKAKSGKLPEYFIAGYFLLWIILFEFILPVNRILPKPSIVLLSFPALVEVYHLFSNLISSIMAVYFPLAVSFFFIWLFRRNLINKRDIISSFIISIEWFALFIPGIILSLLMIYWFPDSPYIKYLFIFLSASGSLIFKLHNEIKRIPTDYLDAAVSLNYDRKMIENIKWKSFEPKFVSHISSLHIYLWSSMLIFEFIQGYNGLGSIYRLSLLYKDLAALFTTLFITGVIIYTGSLLLKVVINKYGGEE